MIEAVRIVKDYGTHRALNDVSFTVRQGEIVGLLGPNGAGKTTTMRIITGFIPATSGEVYLGDSEVHSAPMEIKKKIGYMPENISLYTEMRVRDYLEFCAALKQVPVSKRQERVEYAMEMVHIADREKFVIGRLSKGYRQRVGLAQAILHDPEVLILDEPTVGLDPRQIVEIRSLIRSLAGDRTVILSTHILPEVEQTCERVIIINKGNLIAKDTIEGLRETVEREIKGSNILLRVKEDRDEAMRHLRKMFGVIQVREDDEEFIAVECEGGKDLRAEAAKHLISGGFSLLELRSNEIDLEDIFLHFTKEKV